MQVISRSCLPDAIGLAVIALSSWLVVWALFSLQGLTSPLTAWIIALPFLAGGSLYLWYGSAKIKGLTLDQWGVAALFSPFLGAVSFAIDVLVGSSNGPYKTFIEAATHAGSPMGFPLTIIICPIGTIIALGGWARSAVHKVLSPEQP